MAVKTIISVVLVIAAARNVVSAPAISMISMRQNTNDNPGTQAVYNQERQVVQEQRALVDSWSQKRENSNDEPSVVAEKRESSHDKLDVATEKRQNTNDNPGTQEVYAAEWQVIQWQQEEIARQKALEATWHKKREDSNDDPSAAAEKRQNTNDNPGTQEVYAAEYQVIKWQQEEIARQKALEATWHKKREDSNGDPGAVVEKRQNTNDNPGTQEVYAAEYKVIQEQQAEIQRQKDLEATWHKKRENSNDEPSGTTEKRQNTNDNPGTQEVYAAEWQVIQWQQEEIARQKALEATWHKKRESSNDDPSAAAEKRQNTNDNPGTQEVYAAEYKVIQEQQAEIQRQKDLEATWKDKRQNSNDDQLPNGGEGVAKRAASIVHQHRDLVNPWNQKREYLAFTW